MPHFASRHVPALVLTSSLVVCLTGCDSSSAQTVTPPPALARMSYQLGGAYTPPVGTAIVVRDRTDEISPLVDYNVCYLNLLQTQPDGDEPDADDPGTTAWWQKHHPELLLRNAAEEVVIDADWNEALFDVSVASKREQLFAIHREWIADCAASGFDAIEADNIDANERAQGLLTHDDIRTYMTLVVAYSHELGMAVAQKNAIDPVQGFGTDGPTFVGAGEGFDFAIVEQCATFNECDAYIAVYGDRVYDIEYDDESFGHACEAFDRSISIQLRDLELVVAGREGYIEEWCEPEDATASRSHDNGNIPTA